MSASPTGAGNRQALRPLIILDRDGVINHDSTTFIKSPDEWVSLPGSPEAIAQLNNGGFTVIVATNQSGIGRGLFSLEALNKIHDKMNAVVTAAGGHIEAIFFCPHHPDENCDCRKPKTGLLELITRQYECDAKDLIIIGDSWRDLQAAITFGATPILVRTGNGRTTEKNLLSDQHIEVFDDLAAVTAKLTA